MDQNEFTQRVRERAFEIWQREGEPAGRHLENWLQAKAEIERETGVSAPRTRARRAANGANGEHKAPAKRAVAKPAAKTRATRAKPAPTA